MQVGVLGPVQATGVSGPVALGTPRQRALLTALALHAGRHVPLDLLVDLVWGERAPGSVQTTVHAYVSGLRRALEPDREPRTPASVLVTVPSGYSLRLADGALDVDRFGRTVREVHRGLTPYAALLPERGRARPDAAELAELAGRLDEVLVLWRGEPYADLGDAEDVRAERARLDELRLVALEDRAVVHLWLGQEATVAAELEALTAAFPLRERLWGLRVLALARTGRQADALAALAEVRTLLDDQLGLEPDAELRALQSAVLRQDAGLRWIAAADTGAPRADPTPNHASPPAPASDERWPMVGRDPQRQVLLDLVTGAVQGRPGLASVVGEPGIGKTRLVGDVADWARGHEVRVLTGRCSQDEGAPPLWPWAAVLRGLGRSLPDPGPAASDFAVWEEIVAALTGSAASRPTLVVLDDLHWADPATLRVLRLLVENAEPARLAVLMTWRAHPAPTGALGDLAESLARRHAVRVALTGLSAEDTAALVDTVVGTRPDPDQADALVRRTDGNPFFLVEYAQLAAERGDLQTLLGEPGPPTAVQEVLVRRLDRLPEPTRAALRLAAVLGRQFELDVLATTSGVGEDALLDHLDAAVAAGLVRDDGVDRFAFAHALVRDTAYLALPGSRRARAHAAAARVLQDRPARETEVARHWRAAGPPYAAQAWRAAVVAATVATRVHAHEQAAELFGDALAAMGADPAAGPRERYEVLLQLVEANRWAARWRPLVAAAEEAIGLARGLDDVDLLGRAAVATTVGALWQSATYGRSNPVLVEALRECVRRLPAADHPLRARVMLSLAIETYYGATFAERLALVDEALAMAGRLGDDQLLLDSYLVGFSALWRSSTAERRLGYARAAADLATRLGQEQAWVLAATLAAVTEAELGQVEAMWQTARAAVAVAERLHLPYSQIVLDHLLSGFHAMAGRFDEAEALLARVVRAHEQMSVEQSAEAVVGALVVLRQWQGRSAETLALLQQLRQGPLPVTAIVAATLLRAGLRAEAEAVYRSAPIDLEADDWLSLYTWCSAAEVGLAFADRPLAAAAYARLAPYAGRVCLAGSGNPAGPVDMFLAMAAAAVGETAAATRHAAAAEQLMQRWDVPLVAAWFREQRETRGW